MVSPITNYEFEFRNFNIFFLIKTIFRPITKEYGGFILSCKQLLLIKARLRKHNEHEFRNLELVKLIF